MDDLKRKDISASQLRVLSPSDVLTVDRALAEVCPFGEVRLIVRRGRLRFIEKIKSLAVPEAGEGERETQ